MLTVDSKLSAVRSRTSEAATKAYPGRERNGVSREWKHRIASALTLPKRNAALRAEERRMSDVGEGEEWD